MSKNKDKTDIVKPINGQVADIQLSHAEKIPNFVIFQTATGKVNIEVFFHNETLWLTQKKLAELFEKERSVITKHLKNIFAEGELDENSVRADFAHTAEDGKNYKTKYYNLKAITAVGYRVNSHRATEFRKWATEKCQHLRQKLKQKVNMTNLELNRIGIIFPILMK